MKRFHVEQKKKGRANARLFVLIAVLTLAFSCGPVQDRTTIPDFLIEPNGKAVIGSGPLHAFVFEDRQERITFQAYLVSKLDSRTYNETTYPIEIDGNRYRLLLYDNSEFEKYFHLTKYIPTYSRNATEENVARPPFIAVSVVSDRNDDCLAENSIFRNIVTQYLEDLKSEYESYQ